MLANINVSFCINTFIDTVDTSYLVAKVIIYLTLVVTILNSLFVPTFICLLLANKLAHCIRFPVLRFCFQNKGAGVNGYVYIIFKQISSYVTIMGW